MKYLDSAMKLLLIGSILYILTLYWYKFLALPLPFRMTRISHDGYITYSLTYIKKCTYIDARILKLIRNADTITYIYGQFHKLS